MPQKNKKQIDSHQQFLLFFNEIKLKKPENVKILDLEKYREKIANKNDLKMLDELIDEIRHMYQ